MLFLDFSEYSTFQRYAGMQCVGVNTVSCPWGDKLSKNILSNSVYS